MAERTWIEQIVERVVQQVLETHIPRLREDLVQRVMAELQPELQASGSSDHSAKPAELLRAISEIHAGGSQKEILRGLLDGCSRYCGRVALFVVKGGIATGWQGRGFSEGDSVKEFVLDLSANLVSQSLMERAAVAGSVADMDGRFLQKFGNPSNPEIAMMPLMLKDKVAALVYADGGREGRLDSHALELLVVSTSSWLEVISLRKQSAREGSAEMTERAAAAPASAASVPTQTVQSFNDPFAGHSPIHANAHAPVHVEESASHTATAAEISEDVAVVESPVPAAVEAAPDGLSAEDQETHRKAQRFAKLLVDEIKLYNQAKVSEGRKTRDVYDRLKEDIDKSRATYNKRYGNSSAASGNYFSNEVVRSLAEDDVSLMGANFRR
jgi:hypothetical protein